VARGDRNPYGVPESRGPYSLIIGGKLASPQCQGSYDDSLKAQYMGDRKIVGGVHALATSKNVRTE
jgi:hypothetical protein